MRAPARTALLLLVAFAAVPARADDATEAKARGRYSDGEAALRLGHYLDAVQAFEDAYRLSNKVEILYNIGLAYRRAYSVDGRPEYLRRAMDIYRTFSQLATSPVEKRAADQAIDQLGAQLRQIDEQERLARLRAQANGPLANAVRLYSEGRAPEAERALTGLLHRGRNPPSMVVDIYRLLGQIFADTADGAAAVDAFRKLLALDPDFTLAPTAQPLAKRALARAQAQAEGRGALGMTHLPPPAATPDQPLGLSLAIDNDPLDMVARVTVWYRRQGQRRFSSVTVAKGGDLSIPGLDIPASDDEYRVEYFIDAFDRWGNVLTSIGSTQAPLSFPVLTNAEVEQRAEAARAWYTRPWPWVGIAAGVAVVAGAAAYAYMKYSTPPSSLWGVIQSMPR